MKTPRDDGLHVVAKDGALTPTPFFILPCVAFPTHHVVSSPPLFLFLPNTVSIANAKMYPPGYVHSKNNNHVKGEQFYCKGCNKFGSNKGRVHNVGDMCAGPYKWERK